MKNNNFKFWYIGILFAFIVMFFAYRYFRKESLYKNAKIGNAYIYEINQGTVKSGNIVIKYYFFYKQKKYEGGIDSDIQYEVKNKLLYTYFPVLYDTLQPNNNVLLVNLKRWEKLNLNFPDSLIWLKKYYPNFSF